MKKLEQMTDRELQESGIKLLNSIKKNVSTVTTIVIIYAIFYLIGAIYSLIVA